MYVTVVQMVVFYCNMSVYSSAVYNKQCNLFNKIFMQFSLLELLARVRVYIT